MRESLIDCSGNFKVNLNFKRPAAEVKKRLEWKENKFSNCTSGRWRRATRHNDFCSWNQGHVEFMQPALK
jgi:hypothetical protein